MATSVYAGEVAFFYALDADLKELRGDAVADVREVNGTVIQSFQIGNHRVSAARMGVGNAETLWTAAQVLGFRRPDVIVATGPAGSLKSEFSAGSVCRICQVIAYQRGTFGEAGWALAPESVIDCGNMEGEILKKIPEAKLAAGDAFVADPGARDQILSISQADLVDMNSYGLGVASRKTRIPMLLLKIVSDEADNLAGEKFRAFVGNYDGRLGKIVRDFILQMPVSKESPEAYKNIQRLLE